VTVSLRRRTFDNIGYNAIAKAIALTFQALANIVLSRNLTSADYGIVGFAFIFINFLTQFSDFGINSAAVQARELDEAELATAFWMKLGLGIALFTAALVGAPCALLFLDNTAIVGVIRLLSLNFAITGFGFIPATLLTRALDYRTLAIVQAVSTIVNAIVAIMFAITGFGYWSIVFASLATSAALAIGLNIAKRHQPAWRFEPRAARQFFQYGASLFGSGLVMFATFNADSFLIGAMLGSTALGFYTLAFAWGTSICTLIGGVVNSVLFPTMARIQADRDRVRGAYLTSIEYISAIGIFVNTTLFFVAPDFLTHILGHGTAKWMPALGVLRILCVYGVIRVVLEPLGSVIMALGRPRILFRSTLVVAMLELTLLYPAVTHFGLTGAAAAITVAYSVQYAIYYPFVRQELSLGWHDTVRVLLPAISTLLVLVPVLLAYQHGVDSENTLAALIHKSILCGATYIFAYGLMTRWKALKEMRSLLFQAR
jgi:lipopolysaccharide exporter